jgi:predicted nuclease of restriction endonuclease-like RecB superfamily
MLRSEHSIVRYDFHKRQVHPDRLRRGRDDHYLSAAKILIRLYRDGLGKSRQAIHRDVEATLSRLPDCPPRRIAAFCKLLDDRAEFDGDKKAAVALRREVFLLAAEMHPIVETAEGIFEQTIEKARSAVSESLGMPWNQIDARLFRDVIELQTLKSFDASIQPADLLSIYNVAQTQAALYRATRVRIDAFADFQTVLQHAKLAGLMHVITRIEGDRPGYRIDLDGPQSGLRETARYGVRFAAMLPKLLACRHWRLRAQIAGPTGQRFQLDLSPADRLRSLLESTAEFDSELEREIFETWNKSPVEGWTMERESELLHCGQTVLTPDFALRHRSTDQTIHVEVVGYWTPEYLEEKCRRLRTFIEAEPLCEWLLIFPKRGSASRREKFSGLAVTCIEFDRRKKPQQWIDALSKPVGQAQHDH